MRSAFAPVAVAIVALLASGVRWILQGSRNFYTAVEKQFYVPDPDVGWTISDERAIWLGLEVVGIIAAVTAGLVVGGWIIRRREQRTGGRAKLLRAASWTAAVLPLAIPVAAFATGFGPDGGRDMRPARAAAASDAGGPAAPQVTIEGKLALPAGRYEVVAHKNTAIIAQLEAGGDAFDARFSEVAGEWRVDPADLAKPMTAEIRAAAASVDTGIDTRSKHAREGYLHAEQFPHIGWKLDRLVAVRQDGPDRIEYRAAGTVSLMGKLHAVDVAGSVKRADAAALDRLGLTGVGAIAEADFVLPIRETALAADAGSFKSDRFPIHVSLVLRHTGEH